MRYHFAGVAGQICQQVKFFRREMDGAVLYKNGAGSRIDSEVARFYRLQFRGFRPHAAKIGADARQEFLDAERLGHEVIRTRIQSLDLGPLLTPYREHDDRDL